MHSANADSLNLFVEGLLPHSMELCMSRNANHVMQKLVSGMNCCQARRLTAKLTDDTLDIAQHQFGCRVFERLLERFCDHAEVPEMRNVEDVFETNAVAL